MILFAKAGKEALMSAISRREFCKNAATQVAAAGLLGAGALELRGNPLGMPIGCQTWPVREMIAKDFPGTIKQLAAAGFQTVELCSPVGYADSGFAGLAKYTGAELRKILSDAGVSLCEFALRHRGTPEEYGRTNCVGERCRADANDRANLEGPEKPTLDDVKRAAEEYNKMGEQAAKAGIQQGLHNEEFEMTSVNGKRTYDILLELLDAKLVKFQFQVSTISHGFVAAEYFTKYPGRFFSMHVQGWSAKTKKEMAVGKDDLDWKKIFTAAKTGGVKNYFVEMDLEKMKASVPYLRELQV